MERRGKDGAFRVNTLHLLARPARDKESKRATGRGDADSEGGGLRGAGVELRPSNDAICLPPEAAADHTAARQPIR